ncbi:hypothetical protein TSACC_22604 [Terrimicrobium sacchariphilum]|uniref:Uncharacterized protein n=1 Tax=Terrimicrobium sacchariphilum TaxID=690879 RepID=A0A146G9P0_TERSA|nr:hypothetical protein [Terrimicrobium sacchariphilum]GAT34180.1 hypothetical protein TSACC_22604 [Terrimicrobium sacchariphilum]
MKRLTVIFSTALVTVAAVSPLSAQQQGQQQQQQTQAPAQTSLTNKQRAELAKALAGVDATNPEAVTKAVLGVIAQYPSLAPLFTGEAIKAVTANPALSSNPTAAAKVVSAVVSAVVSTYPAAAQPIVSAAVKAVPATLKPAVVPAMVDKAIASVSTVATKAAILNGAKEGVGGIPSLIATLDKVAQDNNIKIDENSDTSGNTRYTIADQLADSYISGDQGSDTGIGAAPLPNSSGGGSGSNSNPGATGNQPAPSSAGS